MKYRKKPVIIEAETWVRHGDNRDVKEYDPYTEKLRLCDECHKSWFHHGWISTLEGGHIVCSGDWIITGIKGEKYPCKPDIFELTYERVED